LLASGYTVSVLLGRGEGLFGTASHYFVSGLPPVSLAVSDLNGDGRPDLAVATVNGGVGVLFGNGDGTFQTAVIYFSGGAEWFLLPSSVAISDLNHDGKPDLLVVSGGAAYGSDGAVDILLNNRQGPPYTTTTTTLVSSANPVALNQGITYTATVTSQSGGAITGTVTFQDATAFGGRPVAIQPLTGSQVSCSVSYSKTGTHPITASYSGDAANGFSNSSTVLEFAGRLPVATTTFASTSDPLSLYGQAVTFSARVTWLDGTAPDGESVTFSDDANVIGTGTTVGGVATLTTSSLAAGTHVIAASYPGDATLKASLGKITQIVKSLPVATTTSLLTSGSPSLLGEPVTFSATVTSFYGAIPNSELVTFSASGTVIGTGTTVGGLATFTTSFLTPKPHTIKATYAGDATFATSFGTVTQVVDKNATSTILASSLNPSVYGQSVTWTATVTTLGSVAPTGKVNFTWDGNSIGTTTLNAGGVATLTKSTLDADPYPLTAVYLGDASNAGSTSPILNQVVTQATSTATLTSSPNPSTEGQSVTFTAKITSPTVAATGPVTFTAGKTVLGTAQLSNGKAEFTTSTLAVGSTTVTATYNGDSNIAASSASVTQTVQQ
jgi:hypothetical protein